MWEKVQRAFGTGVPSFANEVENTATLPQQRPWASQVGVLKYALHYQDLCRNHLGDWYLLGCSFQKQREPLKGFSSCQSCRYWWEPLGCACKLRGRLREKWESKERSLWEPETPLRSSWTSSRKQRATQLRDESGDLAALHVREISAQTISHVHFYSVRKSSFPV